MGHRSRRGVRGGIFAEPIIGIAVAAGVGLLGACFVISYTAQVHSSYGDSSAGLPAFTVSQEIVHFSGRSAERLESRQDTFAARADGSYARTFSIRSPKGEIGRAFEAVDLRGRTAIVAEPFTRSRVTMHLSLAEVRERRAAARSGCLGIALDGAPRSSFLGLEAALTVRKSKTETVEVWLAPALNCFPLRKTFSMAAGSRTEITTRAISLSEPPASAFEPPLDYVERSPAQVQAAYRARFGARSLWSEEMLQRLEERYWKHRGR